MGSGVIIDGVNVAECSYYDNENGNCNNYVCGYGCADSTNSNCYYKQLQRAKAENEEWQKRYDILQEDRVKLWTDNTNFKQALEEIKKLLKGHKIADEARIKIILDKINEVLDD